MRLVPREKYKAPESYRFRASTPTIMTSRGDIQNRNTTNSKKKAD